jgi:hypothetical protein
MKIHEKKYPQIGDASRAWLRPFRKETNRDTSQAGAVHNECVLHTEDADIECESALLALVVSDHNSQRCISRRKLKVRTRDLATAARHRTREDAVRAPASLGCSVRMIWVRSCRPTCLYDRKYPTWLLQYWRREN